MPGCRMKLNRWEIQGIALQSDSVIAQVCEQGRCCVTPAHERGRLLPTKEEEQIDREDDVPREVFLFPGSRLGVS